MSLVAYDDSEESGIESENDEDANATADTVKKTPVIISESNSKINDKTGNTPVLKTDVKDGKSDLNSNSSTHPSMALPSSHSTNINFDMKILDKKRSQPIRITIPSLKDFEEEEPKKPKLRPSTKGSSLFSILPAPKNVTSSASKALMPQSVSKAKKPKSTPPMKRPTKSVSAAKKPIGDDEEEGDCSSEPLTSFFFSGADDEPLPPPIDIETPTLVDDSAPSSSSVVESLSYHDQVTTSTIEIIGGSQFANDGALTAEGSHQAYSTNEDQSPLDVDALRKLCGARDRKKGPDLSEIIDVSGSTLVGDSSMILAKELTKEQPTHSFKRKSECSSLQRRKHQITYLAEQAKAQELELRNNWAQNRITRKQTQAKYGF